LTPCAGRAVPYSRSVTSLRSLVVVLSAALVIASAGFAGSEGVASADVSSLSSSPITIYGAKWCSACRTLEGGLKGRKIAFEVIDVDDNPSAFSRARAAAGAASAIPLTSIARNGNTVWVVGADIDAVDRAQRGD
jgi:mycoredoxin